jgi:hypothetical protein
MKKSILGLEGVEVLTRNQMKNLNGGGERCETISVSPSIFLQAGEPIAPCTVTYRCRSTILGIGIGSWGEEQSGPSWSC